MVSQSSSKRRAVDDPEHQGKPLAVPIEDPADDEMIPTSGPVIKLDAEHRKRLMKRLNIHDDVVPLQNAEEAYRLQTEAKDFDENEDLLNVYVPPKYEDFMGGADDRRMIIKDIYVDNFKSYRGRHQIGPFHKNLTMILGPNGSGKSNVIDAILFVFGFRAQKIRTKKLSALIHSSDECKSALVEIHFQQVQDINEEQYFVAPNKSFIIARSVQRDEKSQYFLNGDVVPQKRVQELLRSCGIDTSHNRFLILQGEVEAIAQMKPTSKNQNEEGMLEYIEDIVGTNRYVVPIKKLIHRVAMLEYKSSQYTAACRRHDDLRSRFVTALDNAIEYINTKNHLNSERGFINKIEQHQHKELLADAEEALKAREAELDVQKEKLMETKKEADVKSLEVNAARQIVQDQTTERIDLQQTFVHLEESYVERQALIKACNVELNRLFEQQDKVRREHEELKGIPEKARKLLGNMRTELDELIGQKDLVMSEMTRNLERAEEKSKPEKMKCEKAEKEYSDCNTALMNTTAEVSILEDELKSMRLHDGEGKKKLDELVEKRNNMVTQLEREQAEVAKIRPEYDAAKKKLDAAQQQLVVCEQNRDLQLTRYAQMEVELEEFNHADKKSSVYQHASTAALQKLKDEGKFPGFVGRLGDLARIPKKYDATISTNFGACLDYHVVKTAEDAKLGVNLSNDHKLLRSTFFQLDYMTPECYKHINEPKHKYPAERLADQIQCDNLDIRRAFYFQLGNILVVKNLEEAQRLSNKYVGKYRYCTLEGSLLNRDGSLTGGGKPSTNKMNTTEGSASSNAEKRNYIQKLRTQSDSLKRDLETGLTKIQQLEATIHKSAPIVKRLEPKIRQLDDSIEELNEKLPALQSEVDTLTKRIALASVHEVTKEDMEAKRRELAALQQKMVQQKKAMEQAKVIVNRSTAKIERMFIELVDKEKDKRDQLASRIRGLEEAMAREQSMADNNPVQLEAKTMELEEVDELVSLRVDESKRLMTAERDRPPEDLIAMMKRIEELWDAARCSQITLVAIEEEYNVYLENYKRVTGDHRIAEYTQQASQKVYDDLEDHVAKLVDEQERIEDSWMTPETLDPVANYVHENDPDMHDRLDEQYIILPTEVTNRLLDFKTRYEKFSGDPTSIETRVCEIQHNIEHLERHAERIRQSCDEKGITQYCMLYSLQLNEVNASNASNASLRAHRKKLNSLKHARLSEFNEALVFLGTTTQMLYQMITNGGDASLKFVEEGKSTDPFEGGVKFSVRPAKKSWKLIENLSGGEKTLASLCFVFAMHHFRATPLYVMDEIDAALDLNNVRLIASYIKNSERTRNAQFIIISLRNQMFEVGNRLIGIYKVNGCTHNVVINPDSVENGFKKNIKKLEVGISGVRKAKQDEELEIERRMRESFERVVRIEPTPTASPASSMPPPKPRRKRPLGNLALADFGVDSEEEENAENECPRLMRMSASVERQVTVYTYLELVEQEQRERQQMREQGGTESSSEQREQSEMSTSTRHSYQEFDEEGDEPITIRKKKKIADDDDDDEFYDDEEEDDEEAEPIDEGVEELSVGRALPSKRRR